MSEASQLRRIADALERVAAVMESKGPVEVPTKNIFVKLDGKTISDAVMEHTLQRAARGPSETVGGSLTASRMNCSICKLTFRGEDATARCGRIPSERPGSRSFCDLWKTS